MKIKALDRLIVAKYIETLHRAGKNALGCNMDLAETEQVICCECFVNTCIVAHKLIKLILIA